MTLKLGAAKQTITPPEPVRLAGYASRTSPFERVRQDIYVRVHDYRCGTERVVLIYGDLIWWNSEFIAAARPRLAHTLGVTEQQLLFCASHNHSGSGTGETFTPLLETADPNYTDFLYDRIEQTALQAADDVEPVTGTIFRGECPLNVYRRLRTPSGISMRPNYSVPADHHLTVVRFCREDGSEKGLLVHYACHANLSSENELHPDYPGEVLSILDAQFPGCIALFLQGCTADLRANSVLGEEFVSQSSSGIRQFARQLADECLKIMKEDGEMLGEEIRLFTRCENLPLDQTQLANALKEAEHGDPAHRQWAEVVRRKQCRSYEILEISMLRLGVLSVYFFNAEVSQFYAAAAREVRPGALSAGYSNGMIGYLPTARQIEHGGYEPVSSAVYFALAGTFLPQIESLIAGCIRDLAEEQ